MKHNERIQRFIWLCPIPFTEEGDRIKEVRLTGQEWREATDNGLTCVKLFKRLQSQLPQDVKILVRDGVIISQCQNSKGEDMDALSFLITSNDFAVIKDGEDYPIQEFD